MPETNPGTHKKLYVLDTNVLMHDPSSIYSFQDNDVFIPMIVLEELDQGKKGYSDIARNVRQVSRTLDELMRTTNSENIAEGVPIVTYGEQENDSEASGKLFFQADVIEERDVMGLVAGKADNSILHVCLHLIDKYTRKVEYDKVVLVSKDINCRIKATILGIHAEDYHRDQVVRDIDHVPPGFTTLDQDFWNDAKFIDQEHPSGTELVTYRHPDVVNFNPTEFIIKGDGTGEYIICNKPANDTMVLRPIRNYRSKQHLVWGVEARNDGQNYAFNLLMDPEIDLVTLLGPAGTGKTLLALAAGLTQTLEENRYREIIMTRVTVPVGDDIGFLPGTEEEKMTPWMGALMDNLDVLTKSEEGGDWGKAATHDLLRNRIKIRSMNFMRGRTFLNKYLILDEAQNLTPKQMKTLVTRAGPGTKMVVLGNVAQIDTPYLTETSSGLPYLVERFLPWQHSGHVILQRGERSRLADYGEEHL